MHALLTKEFRLVVHPATYMLVVLGALVLIPSWPYAVIILYGILVAFFNAQNAREMRDLSYSFALPASRRDMVRARVLVMVIVELEMTAIMALCICLRPVLGIDAVRNTADGGFAGQRRAPGFYACDLRHLQSRLLRAVFQEPDEDRSAVSPGLHPRDRVWRCVRGGPVHPSRGLRTHQYAGIWKPWRPAHRAIRGHRALRRAQRACNQARLARHRHVRRVKPNLALDTSLARLSKEAIDQRSIVSMPAL